jgi:hypothetical protein
MSDDIVTRLREKYLGQLPICLEAADEIERLRKIIIDFVWAENKYEDAISGNPDIVEFDDEMRSAWTALYDEAGKW